MNKKSTAFAALTLLGFGVTSLLHATEPTSPTAPSTPPVAPAKQVTVEPPAEAKLTLARNGADVVVSWSLPPGNYRSIQITRHTQSEPRGRTGVGSVGPSTTSYPDTLPDKTATYWYWIKVTQTDLSVFNVGPVISKPAEVWNP
jgi:hypothetical protein